MTQGMPRDAAQQDIARQDSGQLDNGPHEEPRRDIVPLNNVDHADLTIATGYGAAFGDAINQVRVFPTEYEALQRDYPILFRQDDSGSLYAVALTGFDRDENLFLAHGDWQASYIPALQRRGPFSIGLHGDDVDDPQINVDLAHPRIVAGGAPVFLRHGGNAPLLDEAAGALATIYDGLQAEPAMFAAFGAAELLESVSIDVELGDGLTCAIDDVFTIDRERLAALDGDALARLHRRGWLAAAFWASASLANITRLIDRKLGRGAG